MATALSLAFADLKLKARHQGQHAALPANGHAHADMYASACGYMLH
jgi:hypothetical protein